MIILYFLFLGLKFWKAGARKIFALKENDVRVLQRATNTSTIFIDSEDSDDDFELPPLKKIYKPSTTSGKGAEVNVSAVMQEIKGIRNDLKFLNKITRDDEIPVALQKLLHDTFTSVYTNHPTNNILKVLQEDSWLPNLR